MSNLAVIFANLAVFLSHLAEPSGTWRWPKTEPSIRSSSRNRRTWRFWPEND